MRKMNAASLEAAWRVDRLFHADSGGTRAAPETYIITTCAKNYTTRMVKVIKPVSPISFLPAFARPAVDDDPTPASISRGLACWRWCEGAPCPGTMRVVDVRARRRSLLVEEYRVVPAGGGVGRRCGGGPGRGRAVDRGDPPPAPSCRSWLLNHLFWVRLLVWWRFPRALGVEGPRGNRHHT